jgi:vacuolar-type H+-ATPase subunit E/Vma4
MARFILTAALWFISVPALAQTPEPTARELLAIINERSKANDQRFEAQERAVAAALAAEKEAVTKAESAAEKRFDSVNEFRGQLKDQTATFVPRAEMVALLKGVDEKTRDNEDKINRLIARSEGANWLWSVIAGVAGLTIGIAGAFIALRKTVRGR